ncbi:hypothetical protein BC834DRAFT_181720 [Gloeopeniophorella convolvens]|nr:hypothetical protein BC834DRAFT_181720 [Gloeopeniophorella convolvens]
MSQGAVIQDYITVVKVLHFIDGLKVWYFLSNLDFDWKLLSGGRTLRWPSLIYLASRFTSIACVISFMIGLNVSHQIDCQPWISIAFTFPLVEFELALLLIVVRVIAIWERSNIVTGIAIATLTVHFGVSLHLLTGIRAAWTVAPDYHGCVVSVPQMHLIAMSIATIATYAILLLTMLAGLLRRRQARSFGVWKMLCQQGWMWFALAVAAEVPTLVLVVVNINHPYNLLLQIPRIVIASIGTTMMFRVLYNYNTGRSRETSGVANILRFRPETMVGSSSAPTSPPFDQLKISVHTTTVGYSDEQVMNFQLQEKALHSQHSTQA